MRRPFVGVFGRNVEGCSCFLPPQSGIEACTVADRTAFACFDRNNAVCRLSQATEPDPVS